MFTEVEIMHEFAIPREYVNGFVYYIAEDAALAAAVKSGNTGHVKFLMSGLAEKYLKMISDE
ncbi:hypothetical protein [uncultured Flavobacterium sp.]|uniref:hypothetical protein n=1 Tax=uncultured Flavobacterium sp. TaxID=165435 RepID=UPI0025DAFB08|nr:hypothetical protein [uncultured Flavobacterium sp.]